MTDGELMTQVQAGDHRAFSELVDRYRNQLVNYLTHLTASRDSAEEFAQEAFLRLYRCADRYDDRGTLAPYLFRIATNLVRSEKRRERRWELLLPRFSANGESRVEPSADRGVLESEIQQQVAEALESLPIRLKSPIILREMEGWSYQEIADSIGCSEGTVKSRIFRGREQLRRRLAPFWNGEEHERRTTEPAAQVTPAAR